MAVSSGEHCRVEKSFNMKHKSLVEYRTPDWVPRQRWTVKHRVVYGAGLSAAFVALACITHAYGLLSGEILLFPVGWIAGRLNPDVGNAQLIVSNCMFWGFLVSFVAFRTWTTPRGTWAAREQDEHQGDATR